MREIYTLYTSPETYETLGPLGLDALENSLEFFNNEKYYILYEVCATGRQSLNGDGNGVASIKFTFFNKVQNELKTRVLNIRIKEDIENGFGVGNFIRDCMSVLDDHGLVFTTHSKKEIIYTNFEKLFNKYTMNNIGAQIAIIPTFYIKTDIMGNNDLLFAINSKNHPSFSFFIKTSCRILKDQKDKIPEDFCDAIASSIKLVISEDANFNEDVKSSLRHFKQYFSEKLSEKLTPDEMLLLEVM